MKLQQKCPISVTSPVAFNGSTERDEGILMTIHIRQRAYMYKHIN